MSKSLRTAALVVGAVALVATGVGAAAGAGLFGAAAAAGAGATLAGISVATIATVGTLASVAAGVLSLAAVAMAKKPSGTMGGNATAFKIDKDAGIPYLIGRSFVGGNVVHRQYYGPKNVYESWVSVTSLGPIDGYESLLIDRKVLSVTGGAVGGTYAGYMWLDEQLGAVPESRALGGPVGAIPGWDGSSKLSGLAAELWTLKFDTKGKVYPNGVPQRGRVARGLRVYDPRQDSTYPGGSGPCRAGIETSYVYSVNAWLHALTFAIGRYQLGELVAGGGMPISGIDVGAFVEAANVFEANGWSCGGLVYTSADNKWDVLQMMAQAGAGEVMPVGALLSCTFAAPRVSLATITSADIAGDIAVPSTAARRDRINGVIPKYRSEAHGWEMVPADLVSAPDYVALDRGRRTREIEYPLVQDVHHVAQLAAYEIVNRRELEPAVFPLKVCWVGYRPGDCVTVDIPEANLNGRTMIIRNREIDPASLIVTLSCRSETEGKHDFALGRTGIPPRTPDLSVPNLSAVAAPAAGSWTVVGTALTANGTSIPALVVTGAVDDPNAEAIAFEYRPTGSTEWIAGGIEAATATKTEITSVTSGTSYDVAVRYRVHGVIGDRLVLGPAAVGAFSVGGPIDTGTNFDVAISAVDSSGAANITISSHHRTYVDISPVEVDGGIVAGLANGTVYWLYYEDPQRLGGAVTYVATTNYADAFQSASDQGRHYVGSIMTPRAGGTGTGGGGATPPGGGPRNPYEREN